MSDPSAITMHRAAATALAAAALAGWAASAAAAPLAVDTVAVARATDQYAIDVRYPKTGVGAIDDPIARWARAMVSDFAAQAEEDFASFADASDRPAWTYSLDLAFTVPRNDETMFVVDFDQSIFTGGAHPNHDIETYNFMMPDGWQVFLPEIFDRSALPLISELAIADLKRQWGGGMMSDEDWLVSGAGPDWDNFNDFLLLPDSLVIRFPPYQVAAYAAGPQTVELPMTELRGLMRTDWRTPVPSFNCADAASATERTVCSDVVLARLDRALASAYRMKLRFAENDEKTAIRDEQRAWIATRNACGSSVLCLTEAYDSRLKALTS